MNICLNTYDRQKIERLAEVMAMNNEAVRVLSAYLTQCPRFITKELIDSFSSECNLTEEDAFRNLVVAACGLDIETNEGERQLATSRLMPAIRQLDPLQYQSDPYYQHIRIPEARYGHWNLKYEHYAPYEAFVCADIVTEDDFRETPQIGFFNREFSFPAVMQDDNEWMAIKPNEIETMRLPIGAVAGRVITFGLGMGYFAYHASEKDTVEQVTIVEKDPEVISLFTTYILPQFPRKDKITLVQADAFEYAAREMPLAHYDYAFTDLWHDVSDGYPLYLKMKKLEPLNPGTVFLYWIEPSLLSHMRWRLFHQMYDVLNTVGSGVDGDTLSVCSYDRFIHILRDPFLKKMACGGNIRV